MIVYLGRFVIKPEMRDRATEMAQKMGTASRAEEGNIRYDFGFDAEDPNVVYLTEIWESDEATERHMTTDHVAEFITGAAEVLADAPSIMRYDISSESRFM